MVIHRRCDDVVRRLFLVDEADARILVDVFVDLLALMDVYLDEKESGEVA